MVRLTSLLFWSEGTPCQSLIKDCLMHQNPKVREDFIKTEDFCETAVSLFAEGSSHSSFCRMQFVCVSMLK